ncbi:hypothetical protein Dimus_017549 [Dionaea muscipula]
MQLQHPLHQCFRSVESGSLFDGRINILTDVEAPISRGFSLKVDEKFFQCRVVEDPSVAMELMRDSHAPLSPPDLELPREDRQSRDSHTNAGRAIGVPVEVHRKPGSTDLSQSTEDASVEGDLSMQSTPSEHACCGVSPVYSMSIGSVCLEEDPRHDFRLMPVNDNLGACDMEDPVDRVVGKEDGNDGDVGHGQLILADDGLSWKGIDQIGPMGLEGDEVCLEPGLGLGDRVVGDGPEDTGLCVVLEGNASTIPPIDLYVDLRGSPPQRHRPRSTSSPSLARGFFPTMSDQEQRFQGCG